MPSFLQQDVLPDLESYDIHPETGFVAVNNSDLSSYYQPWTVLVETLPRLLEAELLGSKIAALPVLGTRLLTTESQWRHAYVMLGYLIQAYIWEVKEKPRTIIPACLGEPWITVCRHLGMMPVLSYAGLCLWNCTIRTEDNHNLSDKSQCVIPNSGTDLKDFTSIQSFASFTSTRDEDAFNLVPVMVEAEGAKLIPLLLNALQTGMNGDQSALQSNLELCASTLKTMTNFLTILHQNCNPDIFFHQIRPLLAGSAGEDSFPNGIKFLQVDKSAVDVRCVGGTAGQSALFQYLDHMFGVKHSSKMLIELRAYMPQKHREFLNMVDEYPSLQEMILKYPDNEALQNTLEQCICNLKEWRTKHIAIVARYIVQPGRGSLNLPGSEEKGTAGSSPVPFLKQYRDETTLDQGATT